MDRDLSTIKKRSLKTVGILTLAGLALVGIVWPTDRVLGKSKAKQESAPMTTLPPHYRDWRLISVAHEAGKLNDLRAVVGNDPAIETYRSGRLPFPDGTMIARLAWAYTSSEENNKAFGQEQSFVAGLPTNVQLMVKDSKRYASTGGWGFAQFTDGRPAGSETTRGCFTCHVPAKGHDYVFTRYAP